MRRLVVFALLLSSCHAVGQKPGPLPAAHTEIRGLLRATDPKDVQHQVVYLEDAAQTPVAQQQTDTQGKFSFMQVGRAIYVVRIKAPGFRPLSERVDLTIASTAYITFDLVPEKERSNAPSAPAGTVTARLAGVPPPALKEFHAGQEHLFKNRQPDKSIEHFQKAVSLYPAFPDAHFLLGTAYMDLGKWAEAQPPLRKAIELDPDLAGAYLSLGSCNNQLGRFAAAEEFLRKGLALKDDSPEGHYEISRSYWALARPADAEQHAWKAISLRSDFAEPHVLLGNAFLRKGESEEALKQFKEYLRLKPNGALAGPVDQMIKKLESATKRR